MMEDDITHSQHDINFTWIDIQFQDFGAFVNLRAPLLGGAGFENFGLWRFLIG